MCGLCPPFIFYILPTLFIFYYTIFLCLFIACINKQKQIYWGHYEIQSIMPWFAILHMKMDFYALM